MLLVKKQQVITCMNFEEFDEYIEELLLLQYEDSEIIKHALTRGEVREDFLIDQIKQSFSNVYVKQGQLSQGIDYSGQLDIILHKNNARLRGLGRATIIEPNDCLMHIEVKSNATHSDLVEFNKKSGKVKELCDSDIKPVSGMFCYSINILQKNFMKKFGYKYDEDLDSYDSQPDLIRFHRVDFVICLNRHDEKYFFLLKDRIQDQYTLFLSNPIIKHFFQLISSLEQRV